MITCLAKFCIRESDSEEKKRRVYGTLGAVVGIFLNICLFTGKYLAGLIQPSDVQLAATDCNGNGVTGEEADLSVLMKFLVGSIKNLPYTEE